MKIRTVSKKVEGLGFDTNDSKGKRHIKQDAIEHTNGQINMTINQLVPKMLELKEQQLKHLARKFKTEMNKKMEALQESKHAKGTQEGELKERENEMQHNLELITSIAQRIDTENRLLIKNNAQLKEDFR